MIILWDDLNKMTVWSSIALAHNIHDLVKGLLEANWYMGQNLYVKATNDLGDTVYLKDIMVDSCMGCTDEVELANCPYCHEEYCENCYVEHAKYCEPKRNKFL